MSNLILFGFKGSGKTYFGKLLAQTAETLFFDTDQLIEKEQRTPVRELYRRLGEKTFRELESKIVRDLSEMKNSVIAVGGGTVLSPENVRLLEQLGQMIYLDAPTETLKKRIGRPAFLKGSIDVIIQKRRLIYETIKAHRIKLDLMDEQTVIKALHSLWIINGRDDRIIP